MKSLNIKNHAILFTILILSSSIVLITSYLMENFLKIYPCKLCLYQRYLHYLLLIYSIIILVYNKIYVIKGYFLKIALIIPIFILMINIVISIFHTGVEKKWWDYESSCVTNFDPSDSFEEYVNKMMKADLVSCAESQFDFLYLSLSSWNAIYCVILLLTSLYLMKKHFNVH